MALIKSSSVKPSEFVNLTSAEKFLPKFMTNVKYVKVSTVDKILASKNDQLSEVDLLKGVKLIENGYVKLVGLVVSGEWNLPDNCKGGVSVCVIDKRLKRSNEATLGSYSTAAAKRKFSFKLIPNYSITTADALKAPWQVLVNIRGVAMEEGFCPLTLEFVSVCLVHKSHVSLGLKQRLTNVSDGGVMELTEDAVGEYIDDTPMAVRYQRFRNNKSKIAGSNNNKFKENKFQKQVSRESKGRLANAPFKRPENQCVDDSGSVVSDGSFSVSSDSEFVGSNV